MKGPIYKLFFVAIILALSISPAFSTGSCDTWQYHRCMDVCARMEHRCSQANGDYDRNDGYISPQCLAEEAICDARCELNGACLPFVVAPSRPGKS